MSFSDLLEKLGRGIFEAPFSTSVNPESPEIAEIRFAVLDQIGNKIERAGGKTMFPYNFVRVNIYAGEQAPVFRHEFFRKFLDQEIRGYLAKSGAQHPDDLQVEIASIEKLAKKDEAWLRIDATSREAPPPPPAPRARRTPTAKLIIIAGKANESEIVLQKGRTNIGRVLEVFRSDGLSRRNDLAFVEENEVNRTVSREHAHIVHDKAAGEYRLFNDRWYKRDARGGNTGLWIMRDGMGQDVHRDARGTKLQNGDEIHLGKAVVRFQAK